MSRYENLRIFSGNANPQLAKAIVNLLKIPPGDIEVGRFSDGEIRVKVNESVRGKDVFVLQPTCPPVNENLMELLIMLDAFKRASAQRLTAVIPYYGYARQEKKLMPREPVAAKLVADLITAAGANRILTVDLHSQAIQGFFNQPVDHVPAGPILANYLLNQGLWGPEVVVVSPDVGGVARASALADRLGSDLAIVVKRRAQPNVAEVMEVIGKVQNKIAVLFDDIIDTGGSVLSGAEALRRRGAKEIYVCATHPVFSGKAAEKLTESEIEKVIVTDTIPLKESQRNDKILVLSVAPVLADAIRRIHESLSVSTLYEKYWRIS